MADFQGSSSNQILGGVGDADNFLGRVLFSDANTTYVTRALSMFSRSWGPGFNIYRSFGSSLHIDSS